MNACHLPKRLCLTLCVAWVSISGWPSRMFAGEFSAEQIAFFEKKIRPVLVTHCYACHSAQSPQVKGGLLLDTRAGILKGGDSGDAVSVGNPDASLLIHALRYADDASAMPPRKQLPEEVIADFEKWIAIGLPDPREGDPIVLSEGIDIEKGGSFWSFQPPVAVSLPEPIDGGWPRTTIDRWVAIGLQERGLKPVADADAETLIRRLYLDLIGLPPTADEVLSWSEQLRGEGGVGVRLTAVDLLIDSLLDSPHFGERWGRHWMDVVRFAETSGRQINFNYPHAWRYRDWVIKAFNDDLPYDQFVRMQIAGDLLPFDDADQRASQLIATGMLAIGPKVHAERKRLQFEMDLVDEQIDVTTQAFLGLTVACARCHDHKFDPIPQRDYYAMAGIFCSTQTQFGTIRVIQSFNETPLEILPTGCSAKSARPPMSVEEWNELRKQRDELKASYDARSREGLPTTGSEFNQLATMTAKLDEFHEDGRPKLKAMAVRDREEVVDCPLYDRGEIDKPLAAVPRGFLQVLSRQPAIIPDRASGRLELADWMASRANPLAARVMVNRIWSHLFGRGIVPTPDNFGTAGMPPDNQALLDHLAVAFMDDGWSIKRLIRRIAQSRVYQLSSRHDPGNFAIDPENVGNWRMSPRRLEAEVLRDSLLSVAGRLEMNPLVGSYVAQAGEDNSNTLLRRLASIDEEHRHRAVYLPVIRDSIVESLALFDFADPSLVVGQRTTTTVPAQSLFLLNSPFVEAQAQAAAQRLLDFATEDEERLKRAYLTFFGRPPSAAELSEGERFLLAYQGTFEGQKTTHAKIVQQGWGALCQALIASGDFLYRR